MILGRFAIEAPSVEFPDTWALIDVYGANEYPSYERAERVAAVVAEWIARCQHEQRDETGMCIWCGDVS